MPIKSTTVLISTIQTHISISITGTVLVVVVGNYLIRFRGMDVSSILQRRSIVQYDTVFDRHNQPIISISAHTCTDVCFLWGA